MLITRPYLRERAVEYARTWAFSQNPLFGDFRDLGGNCTNFVSQCLYAGSCRMNYLPVYGWYYVSLNERSPSWAGVPYLYNFLTSNTGEGPFGREGSPEEAEIGDVIQLGREGEGFYHSLLIVGFEGEDPLVAAQSDDALDRPLSTYTYDFARYIKLLGVRARAPFTTDCYEGTLDGTSLLPYGAGSLDEPSSPPSEEPPSEGTDTEAPPSEGTGDA